MPIVKAVWLLYKNTYVYIIEKSQKSQYTMLQHPLVRRSRALPGTSSQTAPTRRSASLTLTDTCAREWRLWEQLFQEDAGYKYLSDKI